MLNKKLKYIVEQINMYGLDRYIYINESSLSKELCDEIISKYNIEPGRSPGSTFGGINPNVKDTVDYCMMNNPDNPNWSRIKNTLIAELKNNIDIYISKLDRPMYTSLPLVINDKKNKNKCNYKELNIESLFFETLMVQKYQANKGRYVFHQDGASEYSKKRFRVLTYIWYLNDVEEGGETLFWDNYKIKPEKGKLVIFPALWCYPHSGLMPISGDKYIITGWIYQNSSL
jgi:hypothetical protein